MNWLKKERLRKKNIAELEKNILLCTGIEYRFSTLNVEKWRTDKFSIILADNTVMGCEKDDKFIFSLSYLISNPIKQKFLTVDQGAVKFIVNGADVMGKGVVNCDLNIQLSDLVWIREEKYGRPIAIGIALKAGAEIATKPAGKVASLLYYVGSKLWDFETKDA